MRIKSVTDTSILKSGQRLVVLHCLNQCGSDALVELRESVGTDVVKFYRHRQEPVPWTRRSKNGRLFRRPRTTNERRAHFSNNAIKEIFESPRIAFKLRQKRNPRRLPDIYHDLSLRYQRSWKEHRGIQRKNTSSINRQIHSPPFWDWLKCGGIASRCPPVNTGEVLRVCQRRVGNRELPPDPGRKSA